MSTPSPHLGVAIPGPLDGFNTATMADAYTKFDAHPGIKVVTTVQRAALTPWVSQMVYDSDLLSYLCWNGTAWVVPMILRPKATLVRSGGQSIANNTDANVQFTVAEDVSWAMANLGVSNTTVTAAMTTDYDIKAGVQFLEGLHTGWRYAAIIRNGTDVIAEDTKSPITGSPTALTLGRNIKLSTGDTITLRVHHTDGAALSIASATPSVKSTFLSVVGR